MVCKRQKQNMNKKDGNKTFTECKISTTFQKKDFFNFSKILDSKLKGISLDYELLII
jgi:hypothetical protein